MSERDACNALAAEARTLFQEVRPHFGKHQEFDASATTIELLLNDSPGSAALWLLRARKAIEALVALLEAKYDDIPGSFLPRLKGLRDDINMTLPASVRMFEKL